ncbi:MAG: GTPase Era [Flammeovirgaceae bacterium]|jgi:GTPase|nr:GTPase Era [Flammeovirgaceae bacterium]|tara:strand:- start:12216 stop:13109 length:894 start_codon:yes stop_codon:yes gene_type:complete
MSVETNPFKAGFISILGKPNVGKSTLMNALIGERISIMTSKAQTTRHRIFGILSGPDFQMVYSDTPGLIDPQYKLQESMMKFVKASLDDADLIIYMVELGEKFDDNEIVKHLFANSTPKLLIINKIDTSKGSQIEDKITYWQSIFPEATILTISALNKINIDGLFGAIKSALPVHPPYFPADQITDKSERFVTSEIIREKIFMNYKKEIPYSCQVEIEEFKEADDIIRIRALIYVERDSQKGIIIGKKGASLKKVGIESREELEKFFEKKIHLETYVKIEKDWRKKDKSLRKFGYQN